MVQLFKWQGFLNGKLIFHDPPGNYLRSNGTHHLPQSALGAIPKQKMLLPTRAAVTDDLITWVTFHTWGKSITLEEFILKFYSNYKYFQPTAQSTRTTSPMMNRPTMEMTTTMRVMTLYMNVLVIFSTFEILWNIFYWKFLFGNSKFYMKYFEALEDALCRCPDCAYDKKHALEDALGSCPDCAW